MECKSKRNNNFKPSVEENYASRTLTLHTYSVDNGGSGLDCKLC